MSSLTNQIKLHIIVFIFGFTAILGKLIHLPAPVIVWYRTLFAFSTLLIIILFSRKVSLRLPLKAILKIMGIGLIVASHWICFFHAIKVSNVSVTLGTLASGTLFVAFLEPLFNKRKIFWIEVLLGILVIAGLYIIFQFEIHYVAGILFSLLAAFLAALFTVFNKKVIGIYHSNVISFYELLSGFIGISIYFVLTEDFNNFSLAISGSDFIYLLVLATVCTAYAYAATVELMKELSAYLIVLTINLEPVYGIILAYLIFGESEHMSSGFYIGTLLIIFSVFIYPIILKRRNSLKNINFTSKLRDVIK